jgi:hypothetical protein
MVAIRELSARHEGIALTILDRMIDPSAVAS